MMYSKKDRRRDRAFFIILVVLAMGVVAVAIFVREAYL